MTSSPAASLSMFTIDCARPVELAQFYASVLGWDIAYSDDDYAMLSSTGTALGFGRVADLKRASWPDTDSAKRFHLDMQVDDLGVGEARIRELGDRSRSSNRGRALEGDSGPGGATILYLREARWVTGELEQPPQRA